MSYTAIASQTLGSSASSVTFSSIPGTFRDLILVVNLQISGSQAAYLRFNGNSSDYNYVTARGNGSTAASYSAASQSSLDLIQNDSDAGNNSNFIVQIFDYAQTDKHKSVLSRHSHATERGARMTAGGWGNTAAINTVLFTSLGGTYLAGSTFSLFGVSA